MLPEPIQRRFEELRAHVHRYLRWELILKLVAASVVLFWAIYAIDRMLEPSAGVRQVAWLIFGLGLIGWLAWTSGRLLLRPLSDRLLAGWIEQRHPEFEESLITAVELSTVGDAAPDESLSAGDPDQLSVLQRKAATDATATLDQLPEFAVLDRKRLRRWMLGAVLGAVTVIAFGIFSPASFGFYLKRLALSTERWPREVLLAADGFHLEGDRWIRTVPINSDVEINVRARLDSPHKAPAAVRLWRRDAEGQRTRETLAEVGEPTGDDPPTQLFQTRLNSVGANHELWLSGGDASLGPLYLQVEPRPLITDVQLVVTPPAYLKRNAQTLSAATAGPLFEGAQVKIRGTASKALSRLVISEGASTKPPTPEIVDRQFVLEPFSIEGPKTLDLTIYDKYDIAGSQPYRLALEVKPDRLPSVSLEISGVGSTITPAALITAQTNASDDYGLARVALNLAIDDGDWQPITSRDASPRQQQTESEQTDQVDLRQLAPASATPNIAELQPGQLVRLQAEVRDHCTLRQEPQQSLSRELRLAVVTPEELIQRLEEEETDLHRTFQLTVDETRALADRVVAETRPAALLESGQEQEDSEPEGTIQAEEPNAASQRAAALQASRQIDRLKKIQAETRATASGFLQIGEEIENNRIDEKDLLRRIRKRIGEPLRQLADQKLALAIAAVGSTNSEESGQQLADCVTQMQRILAEMKALETYNEVVAMLRTLVREQRELASETEKTRKEQVRRLLFE